MSTLKMNGHGFTYETLPDDIMLAPWEECDGHGEVSEWTSRSKAPHELLLVKDGHLRRYYDLAASLEIARRDCWGLCDEALEALAMRLGRWPSKREITAESVRRDFEYLRGWCNGQWCYVGVIVTHDETGEGASLWGVEDLNGYPEEVAKELAVEILAGLEEQERQARISKRFNEAMECGL